MLVYITPPLKLHNNGVINVNVNPIQSNPMSITEAGQGPLFPSLSRNLKYKKPRLAGFCQKVEKNVFSFFPRKKPDWQK